MTREDEKNAAAPAEPQNIERQNIEPVVDSDPLLGLLRGALGEPPAPARSLLPKIQDRIRRKTRGRYFKDRYSRSLDPIPLLLTMALLLLLIAAAVFLVLQPLSGQPNSVKLPSPPTDLLDSTP